MRFKIAVLLFLVFSVSFSSSASQLEFLILLTRHGSRAAFRNIKNAEHHWKQNDIEQLTPVGMQEAFDFGKEFRAKYIEIDKFLPDNYVNGSIYILSDDFQRTIVTAQCVLMGMYPPGTGPVEQNSKPALPYRFQPVAVRTLPYGSSNLIQGNLNVPASLMNKYLYSTDIWKKKLERVKPFYPIWSKELGNRISDFNDVVGYGDTLETLKVNGYKFPKQLSDKNAEMIIDFDKFFLVQQYKAIQLAYYKNHALFYKIYDDIQNAIKKKSVLKMNYYSGHDLNISGIMSLLSKPLEMQPKLVSNIIFEVYSDNDADYFIKVRFDQKYIEFPFAGDREECSFDDFTKYADSLNSKYSSLLISNK